MRTGLKLSGALLLLVVSFVAGFPEQAEACCACGPQLCQGWCYTTYKSGPAYETCFNDCLVWADQCITSCPVEIC